MTSQMSSSFTAMVHKRRALHRSLGGRQGVEVFVWWLVRSILILRATPCRRRPFPHLQPLLHSHWTCPWLRQRAHRLTHPHPRPPPAGCRGCCCNCTRQGKSEWGTVTGRGGETEGRRHAPNEQLAQQGVGLAFNNLLRFCELHVHVRVRRQQNPCTQRRQNPPARSDEAPLRNCRHLLPNIAPHRPA